MTALPEEIRQLDLHLLPNWLSAHQPSAEDDRGNWWRGLVEELGSEVSQLNERRGNLVDRLICVIERAIVESALDEQEALIRLGYIAAVMAVHQPPPALQPDVIVRRLLDQIPVTADEGQHLTASWQDQRVEVIQTLRAAKNLTGPVQLLQQFITDETLAREAGTWLNLRSSLP